MCICNAASKNIKMESEELHQNHTFLTSTQVHICCYEYEPAHIFLCQPFGYVHRVSEINDNCQILALETGISNDKSYQNDIQSLIYFCYKIKIISLKNSIMLIINLWYIITHIKHFQTKVLWVCFPFLKPQFGELENLRLWRPLDISRYRLQLSTARNCVHTG